MRLVPQRQGPEVRWREEMLGLATAVLEAGLSDLPDVIPVVEGMPPSPGLEGALRGGRHVWSLAVQVAPAPEGVRFALSLCDPVGACRDEALAASRERPEEALGELLARTAHALGRSPSRASREAWEAPVSDDPYAVILAGRSAATWYGLLPAVPEEAVGDKRRDPITRAVLVDPTVALGHWINARRAMRRGQPQLARSGFARASLVEPHRVLFRADEAAAMREMGLAEESLRAWELVESLAPDQLRFVAARARARVEAGEVEEAAALLASLPERHEGDVRAIELWVAIAERGGKAPPYDGLLARWQLADPADPEPVRRRIALRVREGRYDEAVSFLRTLENRGAAAEAAKLAMSLGVATGDYGLAEEKARALRLPETAARIRARAALEARPDRVPPELERADEPVERVARGRAHLRAGDAAAALADADGALAQKPWMPEALALRLEALRRLGRTRDVERAERLLRSADPAWPVVDAPPVPPQAQARGD